MVMKISYDPVKREKTLTERGLDFEDAHEVIANRLISFEDDRFEYPERRWTTFGMLDDRMVALVWTPTWEGIRVISLRKANEREQRKYSGRMD
jgi:uncharacterized protein